MVESMTGYGTSHLDIKGMEWTAVVRSVNGRFLEVKTHLPREVLELEGEIKKNLGETLGRGMVEVFVHRKIKPGGKPKIQINTQVVHEWVGALQALKRKEKLDGGVDLATVLTLPQVVDQEVHGLLSAPEKKMILELIDNAGRACLKERVREGRELLKDFKRHLSDLQRLVGQIGKEAELAQVNKKQRLEEKLNQILDRNLDSMRMSQEILLALERSDIAEELDRLRSHIGYCSALLTEDGRMGKKMDFYSQELLREMNTIGSKSLSASVTALVIEGKSVIERIKEQVQNIA